MSLRGFVFAAQHIGPRDAQEDVAIVQSVWAPNSHGWLLGVCDGHGGSGVANLCAHYIPRMFNPSASNIAAELKRITTAMADRTNLMEAGSTLSLAYIDELRKTVTTAVIGDSPIMVVDSDGCLHLSEEHNVRSNVEEREAAIRRGAVYDKHSGYIYNAPDNDYGLPHDEGLQLSRALGDSVLRFVLDRDPAINTYRLGRYSAVIIGSDGLLDSSHGSAEKNRVRAISALRMVQQGKSADEVLAWRKVAELEDNTTVVTWRARNWLDWFR